MPNKTKVDARVPYNSTPLPTLLFLSSTLIIMLLLLLHPLESTNPTNTNLMDLPMDVPALSTEYKCQLPNTPLCNIAKYKTVQPFNNTLGHTSIDVATAELHKYTYLFSTNPCASKIQLFLCSLYLPICVNVAIVLTPCREGCEEARRVCKPVLEAFNQTWPDEWDCRKFDYYDLNGLCVIDNSNTSTKLSRGRSESPSSSSSQDDQLISRLEETIPGDVRPLYPHSDRSDNLTNESCDDLFDCQIRDPSRKMKLLCIDPNWVCDGKRDCVLGDIGDGLDEKDCDKRCHEGQFFCDGKCISRSDICDGKVDCSLGSDEQDCYDYHTGLIQSIFCIFALFTAIYLLVGFFRVDDQKSHTSSINDTVEQKDYYEPEERLSQTYKTCMQPEIIARPVDVTLTRQFHRNTMDHSSTYQEPYYERVNLGGYSGAASVYSSCPNSRLELPHEALRFHRPERPLYTAAPPPTPVPQMIYSTGSITNSIDLSYGIMHDIHEDLLE